MRTRSISAWLGLLTLGLPASGALARPVRDYGGIYVLMPTAGLENMGMQPGASLYASPAIDGVTLVLPWNLVEPQPGSYDWQAFDTQLASVIASHKRLAIGLLAGAATPAWLYRAPFDVRAATFQIGRSDGRSAACRTVTVPAVWQRPFIDRYASAIRALAGHIRGIPGGWQSVAIARLAAISTVSAELRIDAKTGKPPRGGHGCTSTDTAPVWQAAGYRPSLALRAWADTAAAVADAFPGKELAQAVLKTARATAPPIDENGAIYDGHRPPPGLVPLQTQIIRLAASHYGQGIVIQWNGLTGGNAAQPVLDAKAQGTAIGWQTNQAGGNGDAICGQGNFEEGQACTAATFGDILRHGISLGGTVLEVHPADLRGFAAPVAEARAALLRERQGR